MGFYNEKGQLCLRTEDLPRVQKHFNLLYLNRLQFIGKVIEHQKAQKASQGEYNFKPQLNDNSQYLATQQRQKLQQQLGEDKLSHIQLLYNNGMSKEQFIQSAKKLLDEEQMKECTFKPDLITNKSELSRSIMTQANESKMSVNNQAKYEQLYQLAKNNAQKNKVDKSKEDYEYEKQKNECTFAPKIQNNNNIVRNAEGVQLNVVQDLFVKKQIERLNKGREEKERIKNFMENGVLNKED